MAQDTVQQIKNKLSILDVVGASVKLKRAGKSYVGLCPFHKEKTSSFHVSPERGTFHCFGCGEGGDMFTFVEKTEGVDFKDALKILAEKAGVKIEYSGSNKGEKDTLERLREAMARAAEFYRSKLTDDSEAYRYALSRGLSSETIATWSLGYAPGEWRALLESLSAQGFSVQEILAAGLIKEADGKPGTYYDRFRARLMFPIRDAAGRTVAFTGRALAKEEPAKYLNSPETDLYHKSEILFGMDRAKDAIRTRDFAILVEGQMDLLHAHQAGFTNTVALSGTALTARHLALLKRYSGNLLLSLDADAAGLAATFKSALLALCEGMKVKAAKLPAGKDPADLIAEDPALFTVAIKEAKPVAEFFLGMLLERERDSHRLVTAVERIVLPLIKAVQSPLERDHFVSITARALGLSSEAVVESMKKTPSEQKLEPRLEKTISISLSRPELFAAIVKAYPQTLLAKRVANEYTRVVNAPLPEETVSEAALFEAGIAFGEDPQEEAADDLLRAFEEGAVRAAYQESVQNLRRAEAAGDSAAIKTAEAACRTLSLRLATLTN